MRRPPNEVRRRFSSASDSLNIAARLMRSAPQPQVLKNAALCIAKLMEQNRPAELARRRLRKDSRQPHRRAVGLRIGSTATVI